MLVLQGMMGIIESIKIHYLQTLLFCCMVVGYFYFGYIDFIGPLSLGVVCLIVLFSIFYLNCCMRSSGTFPTPHVTISVVLILLAIWLYVVDGVGFIQLLRRFGIPIMLIFAIREAIKSVRQVNSALVIIAIIVSISCVVAVFQAMGIDFFWELRTMIGMPEHQLLIYQFENRLRAPGLAFYSVQLSYQIVSIFPFIFFLYYLARKSYVRKIIIMFGLCLAYGVMAIQSMSAVVALIVSYITFAKLNRLISLKKLIGLFIVATIILLSISSYNHFSKRFSRVDSTAFARLPLTITGARIILACPLGATGEELINLKREYYADVAYMPGSGRILDTSFHNCLINVGVKYGWVILIAYIWLYLYIFRLIYKAMKNSTIGSADHYFFSSAFAFLVAYFWQGLTHNAGLPSGDPFGWLMVGIILSYRPSQINSSELRKNDKISSIA